VASDDAILLDGEWLLVEIDGEPIDIDAPRSIRFEGGRVSGRVGVNRFAGPYSTNGDVLEIGPVASTRMAGPPELMSLEHHVNTHLEGEHEITLEGDEMVLRVRVTVRFDSPEGDNRHPRTRNPSPGRLSARFPFIGGGDTRGVSVLRLNSLVRGLATHLLHQ
jgi:heat shock protein HslJ